MLGNSTGWPRVCLLRPVYLPTPKAAGRLAQPDQRESAQDVLAYRRKVDFRTAFQNLLTTSCSTPTVISSRISRFSSDPKSFATTHRGYAERGNGRMWTPRWIFEQGLAARSARGSIENISRFLILTTFPAATRRKPYFKERSEAVVGDEL